MGKLSPKSFVDYVLNAKLSFYLWCSLSGDDIYISFLYSYLSFSVEFCCCLFLTLCILSLNLSLPVLLYALVLLTIPLQILRCTALEYFGYAVIEWFCLAHLET